MPIITHEDAIELANIDLKLAKQFSSLSNDMNGIRKQEEKLADSYHKYSKDILEYVSQMKDKLKQLEILMREKASGITEKEVSDHKKKVAETTEKNKMIEGYFDRLKDLVVEKGNLTKVMDEYSKLIVEQAKIRKSVVGFGLKIEKEKNKMVAADNISKTEDKLKDTERQFERVTKELGKKWEQVLEVRGEVNTVWKGFKNSIDDFE